MGTALPQVCSVGSLGKALHLPPAHGLGSISGTAENGLPLLAQFLLAALGINL